MTTLLLIRHGANDWVRDRLAGWTPGVHLNDEGREQTAALARRLADWPIEAIVSSPLERAIETAEAVAALHDLPVRIEAGVGEARYGEWTGQLLSDLAKTPEWPVVQFNPSSARFPGGESLLEVQNRVVAALERLRTAHLQGVVAVFAHSDIIKLAAAHYVGLPMYLFQRLMVDTASVTWIQFTKHGPRLVRLNDSGELKPPARPEEKQHP